MNISIRLDKATRAKWIGLADVLFGGNVSRLIRDAVEKSYGLPRASVKIGRPKKAIEGKGTIENQKKTGRRPARKRPL